MVNAKFFRERPYCNSSGSYKFSSANYLRLLAADNDATCKCNPRWLSVDDIKNNGWALREHSEDKGADTLTSILTVQTWVAESQLKTKMSLFLPTYPDFVLADIEQNPDKLFDSMNNARAILKNLRREKEIPIEENSSADSAFRDLKIIYHASEIDLQDKNRNTYPIESVLTGEAAYEFLCALKSKTSVENFKTWLEFSYKGYSHGKFLLADKIPKDEPIKFILFGCVWRLKIIVPILFKDIT